MILDLLKKQEVPENLNEETAAERFLQEEPEDSHGNTISDVLNECAKKAESFYRVIELKAKRGINPVTANVTNTFNPLFVGPTGVGKTSIIRTWARDHGYDVVTLNMMGDALDFLGVKTINKDYDLQIDDEGNTKKVSRVSTVATQAFDVFLHGRTKILFLDEINKTNPRILQSLYDLISFHTVQNGDEVMYLPKLLFVVGAMNPSDYGGGRDRLDAALKARMQIINVTYDTKGWKDYMERALQQDIDVLEVEIKDILDNGGTEEDIAYLKDDYLELLGKKDILNKLFADISKFHWSDAKSIADVDELDGILVPRTLEAAFNNCNGTREDFLKKVLTQCGVDAATLFDSLLSDYQDSDHKANQIWDKDYSVKEEPEEENLEDENSEDDIEDSVELADGEEEITLSSSALDTLDALSKKLKASLEG